MTEQVGRATGRTRWRRFGLAMIPGLVGAFALGFAVQQGALAASFAVSGTQFKVSSSKLTGTGFQQFGGLDHEANGTPHPVAISVIGSATLEDLCQSVRVSIPGLGSAVVKINAGAGDKVVKATNLVVDATQLAGDANFTNMAIGRDAGEMTGNSQLAGAFGQSASTVTIENLQQTAWATTAGEFTLAGLSLGFSGSECF
ncbi:MAG: DUF6230 family protein [Sporichthyaceae bacterium]|nr:DUF6230 family protein [Sporichthyaceae bacterium]